MIQTPDLCIVVADDRPENITLTVELLRRMDLGAKIYSAPNGRIALTLARKFRPELVLTDWDMPEMDGLELVKALKADIGLQHVPVIMLTAVRTEPEAMQTAFDAGVHDFLRKPFNALEFFARVRNTLALSGAFQELQTSQVQIEQQNQLLRGTVAHQQSLNRFKDQILAIISHDFRSPLATLTGMTSLLASRRRTFSEQERIEFDELMLARLQQTMALLDNLLRWSVAGITTDRDELVEVSVMSVIEEIFDLYRGPAADKVVALHHDLSAEHTLTTHRDMLAFIVRNLVANAVKFTDGGGSVRVTMTQSDGWVTLAVADTGVGMSEAVRAKLFQQSRMKPGQGTAGETGTGIGLLFVQDFVHRLSGRLTVESELGQGTVVRVALPKQ